MRFFNRFKIDKIQSSDLDSNKVDSDIHQDSPDVKKDVNKLTSSVIRGVKSVFSIFSSKNPNENKKNADLVNDLVLDEIIIPPESNEGFSKTELAFFDSFDSSDDDWLIMDFNESTVYEKDLDISHDDNIVFHTNLDISTENNTVFHTNPNNQPLLLDSLSPNSLYSDLLRLRIPNDLIDEYYSDPALDEDLTPDDDFDEKSYVEYNKKKEEDNFSSNPFAIFFNQESYSEFSDEEILKFNNLLLNGETTGDIKFLTYQNSLSDINIEDSIINDYKKAILSGECIPTREFGCYITKLYSIELSDFEKKRHFQDIIDDKIIDDDSFLITILRLRSSLLFTDREIDSLNNILIGVEYETDSDTELFEGLESRKLEYVAFLKLHGTLEPLTDKEEDLLHNCVIADEYDDIPEYLILKTRLISACSIFKTKKNDFAFSELSENTNSIENQSIFFNSENTDLIIDHDPVGGELLNGLSESIPNLLSDNKTDSIENINNLENIDLSNLDQQVEFIYKCINSIFLPFNKRIFESEFLSEINSKYNLDQNWHSCSLFIKKVLIKYPAIVEDFYIHLFRINNRKNIELLSSPLLPYLNCRYETKYNEVSESLVEGSNINTCSLDENTQVSDRTLKLNKISFSSSLRSKIKNKKDAFSSWINNKKQKASNVLKEFTLNPMPFVSKFLKVSTLLKFSVPILSLMLASFNNLGISDVSDNNETIKFLFENFDQVKDYLDNTSFKFLFDSISTFSDTFFNSYDASSDPIVQSTNDSFSNEIQNLISADYNSFDSGVLLPEVSPNLDADYFSESFFENLDYLEQISSDLILDEVDSDLALEEINDRMDVNPLHFLNVNCDVSENTLSENGVESLNPSDSNINTNISYSVNLNDEDSSLLQRDDNGRVIGRLSEGERFKFTGSTDLVSANNGSDDILYAEAKTSDGKTFWVARAYAKPMS